ncbi:MAG: hypothetical protein ACK5QS_01425 [Pseudanabaenaceae cyanobacterium]
MTRKRLTDLLREEAQKPATASPLTVDVVAAPVANTEVNDTDEKPASEKSDKSNSDHSNSLVQVTVSSDSAVPKVSPIENTPKSSEKSTKKPNPEPTSETKKSHHISPDLEAELRQQITELKHSLHLNQTNIEILHSTIEDKNQSLQRLKTELEESRKDNLRLAEANIKLKEELQALQQNPPQPQIPVIPVTTSSRPAYSNQIAPRQPELRRANATSSANQSASQASSQSAPTTSSSSNSSNNNSSSSLSRNPSRAPERTQSRPLDRPGIYGRPIGSNEENQRINNRNIGWMD